MKSAYSAAQHADSANVVLTGATVHASNGSRSITPASFIHQSAVLNNDPDRRIFFTGFGTPTGPSGVDDAAQSTGLIRSDGCVRPSLRAVITMRG